VLDERIVISKGWWRRRDSKLLPTCILRYTEPRHNHDTIDPNPNTSRHLRQDGNQLIDRTTTLPEQKQERSLHEKCALYVHSNHNICMKAGVAYSWLSARYRIA